MWSKVLRLIAQFLLELADTLDKPQPKPLLGFRAWVDEGHGGSYSGAVDAVDPNHNDALYSKESDMNLAFCNLLVEKLKALGAEVFRTRTEDVAVELVDRTNRINVRHKEFPINLCLSIHYNAHTDVAVSGIETFYHPNKLQDKVWADAIQTRLISATGAKNRGAKATDFHMVRVPLCPALLVELGFITNVEEERKLHNEQYRVSQLDAIAQGIIDVWTLNNK